MSIPVLLSVTEPVFAEAFSSWVRRNRPEVQLLTADHPRAAEAQVAACWHPDPQLVRRFPGLRLLQSLAAGVDHMSEEMLDAGLPVCRIVSSQQKHGMFEYILWGVLSFQRYFDRALVQQNAAVWQDCLQRKASEVRIGIMGLGEIGGYVAAKLVAMDYRVAGWSRTPKQIAGVTSHSGDGGLQDLLQDTDILVNLLPLTDATTNLIDQQLIEYLPQGATIINCGRGAHVVEDDLISAVTSGRLRGAILDVFREEPLPAESRLWSTPGILVTPHIASKSDISVIADQLVDNASRHHAGRPLRNKVQHKSR